MEAGKGITKQTGLIGLAIGVTLLFAGAFVIARGWKAGVK